MVQSKFCEVKIICAEDCGNAPKKIRIKEFITAMANNDQIYIAESLASNIVWEIVGEKTVHGEAEFLRNSQPHNNISEVHIHNIITHGNTCAANGTVKFDTRSIAFSHIYRFSSARNVKIKEITSFFIEIFI